MFAGVGIWGRKGSRVILAPGLSGTAGGGWMEAWKHRRMRDTQQRHIEEATHALEFHVLLFR